MSKFPSTAPEKVSEKSLTMSKKIERRGDPLGFSNIQSVPKLEKKMKRGNFFRQKRANRGNFKFCRTFGRTILVTSGVSKKNKNKKITDEKP